jgi:hypothetical protein
MDIGSLLAAVDKEVGDAPSYDDDLFENDVGSPKKSAMDVLKAAANVVEKEEKFEVKKLFKESAKEAKEISDQIIEEQDYKKGGDDDDADVLKMLNDAGKEVEDLHKETNVKIAKKVVVEEEIDHGVETDEDEEFDDDISQQLLHACHLGKLDKVEKLLDKSGVNLMYRDRHGWTPLHWAASKGNTEIMEELIRHRKRQNKKMKKFLNAQDELAGWTPLHVQLYSSASFWI